MTDSRGNDRAFATRALTPILTPQPGVCEICRSWSSTWPRCYPCNSHVGFLHMPEPVVLPMGLAIKYEALASALWAYKWSGHQDESASTVKLRALGEAFMQRHEDCLAGAAGVDTFDVVTWIPSSQARQGRHPLAQLLASSQWARSRLVEVLTIGNPHVPGRGAALDKFALCGDVRGRSVLVVDDTWTTGAHVFSALALLRAEGASVAAAAVYGRHFNPDYRDSRIYSEHARGLAFDINYCAACDPRPPAGPPLGRSSV